MPATAHIRSVQFVCRRTEKIGSTRDFVCRSLNVAPFTWFAVNNDFESMMFWKKKKQQLLKKHGSKAVQIITTQTVKSLACELWNSQKDAEEKARAWANVEMVSCVADPHESKEKCFTNKHRESNWYLSETLVCCSLRA